MTFDENELLTVKQFAEAAGVSTQRIYQRLAKDLQSYCKADENGVKYISVEGLALFQKAENLQGVAKPLQSTCKDLAKTLQGSQELDELRAQKDELEHQVRTLSSELATVKAENELLRSQQEKLEALSDRLTAQLEQQVHDLQERLTRSEQERDTLTKERQTILAELLDLRRPKQAVIEAVPQPKEKSGSQEPLTRTRTHEKPRQQARQGKHTPTLRERLKRIFK